MMIFVPIGVNTFEGESSYKEVLRRIEKFRLLYRMQKQCLKYSAHGVLVICNKKRCVLEFSA